MAAPKSKLYLWNGYKWDSVLTQQSTPTNAVLGLTIEDTLGNPRKADITVINPPYNRFSSNATLRKGPHTDKFSTFSRIMLIDDETHLVVFGGFVASAKGHYDPQYGDTIKITAFDYLDEARNHPVSQLGEEVSGVFNKKKVIPVANTGNVTDENETRQKQIEYLFTDENGMDTDLIDFSDKQDNTTGGNATAESMRKRVNLSYEELEDNDHLLLEAGNRNVLQVVASLANEDPHTNASPDHQTYDYYVDPNIKYPRPTDITTTLGAAITLTSGSGSETVTVANGSVLAEGDVITVDSEDMLINNISTNTLTVTRGVATTAATHLNGATVTTNWVTPHGGTHKQSFNYFRRGYRPNQQPEQYGLNINAPLGGSNESGLRPGTSPLKKARRFMLPASDWEDPTEQLFSHAVVNYNRTYDEQGHGSEGGNTYTVATEGTFELLYVYEISGPFLWHGKKVDTDSSTGVRGVGASEYVSAFRADGSTPLANGGVNVAAIQYQSALANYPAGTNSRNGVESIILSHVKNTFPIANEGGDAFVVLKGNTSGTTCKFNADANITSAWQGRPLAAWGVKRPTRFAYSNSTNVNTFRKALYQKLRRVSKDIRRGSFQTVRGPYAYVEGRLATVQNVTGQPKRKQISLKEHTGVTPLLPRTYGVKAGMTIRFFSDATYKTETAVGWAQIDSYDPAGLGNIGNDLLLINLRNTTAPAVDDYFRIYIPVRAGDAVRVEHAAQGIIGNHLVLSTVHTEGQGRTDTMWKTVGENQDTPLSGTSGDLPGLAPKHKAIIDSMRDTGLVKEVSVGASNFSYETGKFQAALDTDSPATYKQRISWTAGTLHIARGQSFSISAGNSYTALGNTELNSNGTLYYIYFDKASSTSTFQMIAAASYIPNSEKLLIGWATHGDPVAAFNIFNTAVPEQVISGQVIQGGTIRTNATNALHGVVMTGGELTVNNDGATNVGTMSMNYNGSNRMRLRALASHLQLDALYSPLYIHANDTVAPVSAGHIGLGSVTGDRGWRDLILANNETKSVGSGTSWFKITTNGAQAQTDLTWILPPDNGSSGNVLTTDGSGTLSWGTAASHGHSYYQGWTISGVTGGSEMVTNNQGVAFHGSNGITTSYSTASNTLTIDGSGLATSGHSHGSSYTHPDPIKLAVGSASAPTYASTSNNGDSGLYFVQSSNTTFVNVSVTGSERWKFGTTIHFTDASIRPNTTSTGSNVGNSLGWTNNRFNYGYIRDVIEGTSDATLKENLTPISNATAFIKDLVPYEYNFIADRTANINPLPKHFGITAQNLKTTLDSHGYSNNTAWLDEVDDEGTHIQYNVREKKLIHVLIAAVKELEARIATLEGG